MCRQGHTGASNAHKLRPFKLGKGTVYGATGLCIPVGSLRPCFKYLQSIMSAVQAMKLLEHCFVNVTDHLRSILILFGVQWSGVGGRDVCDGVMVRQKVCTSQFFHIL